MLRVLPMLGAPRQARCFNCAAAVNQAIVVGKVRTLHSQQSGDEIIDCIDKRYLQFDEDQKAALEAPLEVEYAGVDPVDLVPFVRCSLCFIGIPAQIR